MPGKILLLTLKTFSFTGGIEKMCRTLICSLTRPGTEKSTDTTVFSMYDKSTDADLRYIEPRNFRGFNGNRLSFVLSAVKQAAGCDVVILSHVNLLFPALLIRMVSPQTRIILFVHGIEVWRPLSRWKTKLLGKLDTIIAVSEFTRSRVIELHGLDAGKVVVLNNALDPFYDFPKDFCRPQFLSERYGLLPGQPVLFTLTRLSASEKYKGYDKVIETLPLLRSRFPDIRYLIAGKYDAAEQTRIEELVREHNLHDLVQLTGFISEDELAAHFLLADLFVMPSKKEGFGIVFIEAMASGLPVIAGNKDGSVDAVKNCSEGSLVDPDDIAALASSISNQLLRIKDSSGLGKQTLSKKTATTFGFEQYKVKLKEILNEFENLK